VYDFQKIFFFAPEVFMEIFSLAEIEFEPESVAKRLRVSDERLLQRLMDSAKAAIAPKAAYQLSYLNNKSDDGVVVDGVHFSSRVLRRNLDEVGRVFPFVLTIGKALEDLVDATGDMLNKYLLDEIGNIALREVRGRFEKHLRATFALEKISFMAPGSLGDWPIEQQKPLFSLLDGVESAIGVSLTSSFLMLPRKSVSGIYFPSEVSFFSCQLCPRERCDGRKARYDKDKAREYGLLRE
jgi:hypothetical protein